MKYATGMETCTKNKGYIFSNEIRYVMRHMGESIPEQDINEILQDHQESRKRKITFEGT